MYKNIETIVALSKLKFLFFMSFVSLILFVIGIYFSHGLLLVITFILIVYSLVKVNVYTKYQKFLSHCIRDEFVTVYVKKPSYLVSFEEDIVLDVENGLKKKKHFLSSMNVFETKKEKCKYNVYMSGLLVKKNSSKTVTLLLKNGKKQELDIHTNENDIEISYNGSDFEFNSI